MARPPLPVGTWGVIRRSELAPGRWMADTLFRDFDGRTRRVERRGSTGAQAEQSLRNYLRTRSRAAQLGELTGETRLREAAALWLVGLQEEGRAPSTLDADADALRLHVVPGLGMLQLREVTVGVCDRFVQSVKANAGPGAARHARTVLSGVLGMAARHEAIRGNPVRDVARISSSREPARSLRPEEVRRLRAGVRADQRAVDRDLPDLVDFMLGTGLRIGEVLAMTWDAVDLASAQVEVRATVVTVKGRGAVLQPRPKTRTGWRGSTCRPGWPGCSRLGSGRAPSGTSSSRRSWGGCGTGRTRTPMCGRPWRRSGSAGLRPTCSARRQRRCSMRAA